MPGRTSSLILPGRSKPARVRSRTRLLGVLCAAAVPMAAAPAAAHASTPAAAGPSREPRRAQAAQALPYVLHRTTPRHAPQAPQQGGGQRAATPRPSIGAPKPEQDPAAAITINSLTRDASGIVTLVWTITYTGETQFNTPTGWQSVYTYASAPVSGVSLTDETAKVRYQPLRIDPRRLCMCNSNADQPNPMRPGDIGDYYQSYKLPDTVTSVTVRLDGYAPAKNVPISR